MLKTLRQNGAIRKKIVSKIPTNVRLQIRRARFRGSEKHCALCNSHVNKFKDFGVKFEVVKRRQIVGSLPFPDDICPVCWGASRSRLISLFLDKKLDLGRKRFKLLHIAPDLGIYYWLRHKKELDYVAGDLEPENYSIVPNVQKVDITDMPFDRAEFDVVICSHVLEHVPEDRKAMLQIRKILKPSGVALFMVPEATDGGGTDEDLTITDWQLRRDLYAQRNHVRLYGRDDFVTRLSSSGYFVEGFDGFSDFPGEAQALSLNPKERLWVCAPASCP